jgi:glycosyltransferase involved in cell wall biosynthesis
VGEGPDRAHLERLGRGRVEFTGWLPDTRIRDEYRRASAVLLPGEEDFGIVPVEAQACGRPVVAYGRGGARETVVADETGVFFDRPDADALAGALERVAALRIDPARIRQHAEQFSRERHMEHMRAVIADTVAAPHGTRW